MFFYEYPTLSYHLKAVFYIIWCFLLCFLEIPFTIDCAFYNCGSLTSITIPDSITYMGACVFMNWTKSQTVYCRATKQPVGWGNSPSLNDWDSFCEANIVWGYTGK